MSLTDTTYQRLLEQVLMEGTRQKSRAGDVIQLIGTSINVMNTEESFPLLSVRKLYPSGVFGELAAFLTGSSSLRTFKEFGCNYWDANAAAWDKNDGVRPENQIVGHIYGYQWRTWNGWLDQIERLVTGLEHDPLSRRHILTTWNPADLRDMCLPPCHLTAQFCVTEPRNQQPLLDCVVYMRSVDLVLGLPSDLILYATLQRLLAQMFDMQSNRLVFHFGNSHIYANHLDNISYLIARSCCLARGPQLELDPNASVYNFRPEQVKVLNYEPYAAIQFTFNP